jgi:hypothetical protein
MMVHSSLGACENHCASNSSCLGFVDFETTSQCKILNNLGIPVVSDEIALSFTKVSTYEHRDIHTVYGEVVNSYPDDDQKIHTFYLDLNRNGVHDEGEPINYTSPTSGFFEFSNISEGNYLIREIPNDNCIQLWPGAWGYSDANTRYGNSYVDSVVQYFHNGHPETIDLDGGVITNELLGDFTSFSPAPVSLILGNSPSTFVSFPPNHGIIVEFLDDVIANGDGNDFVINTFLNSNVYATVFVSSNNIDYYKIGILNNTHNEFDMASLDDDGSNIDHISYLKLEFFLSTNTNTSYGSAGRNIVSIQGLNIDKYFAPAYSAFVTVPQDYSAFFVKDCNYTYTCYTYCLYTRTTFDTIDSCMVGCDLWGETGTCDCNGAIDRGIPFYGETYQKNDCDDGCLYEINYEVFPEYAVKLNASGRLSRITSMIQCKDYDLNGLDPNGCIKDILSLCSRQPSCDAVSLNNHTIGYLYDNELFVDDLESYFIVKRKKLNGGNIENLRYTTPSTTQTTTPSTTQTSTPSTTQTSTPSTTQTSTPSTTQTSTQSTTVSTTPTTTPTTTIRNLSSSKNTLSNTEIGLLVAFLLILLIFIILAIRYCCYKSKKNQQNKKNIQPEISTITDYNNPVYDIGMGQRKYSSSSRNSHSYLDVEPGLSPTHNFEGNYFDVTTVKQESEL